MNNPRIQDPDEGGDKSIIKFEAEEKSVIPVEGGGISQIRGKMIQMDIIEIKRLLRTFVGQPHPGAGSRQDIRRKTCAGL